MISPAVYLGELRAHLPKLIVLATLGSLLTLVGQRYQQADYVATRLLVVSAQGASGWVELSQSGLLAHKHAQSLAYLGNSGSALDGALRELRVSPSVAGDCRASANVPGTTSYLEISVWAPEDALAAALASAVARHIIRLHTGLAPKLQRDTQLSVIVEDVSPGPEENPPQVAGRPKWLILAGGGLALPALAYLFLLVRTSLKPTVGQSWDLEEILPFPILGSLARPSDERADPGLADSLVHAGLTPANADSRLISFTTVDSLRDCHPVLDLGGLLAQGGRQVLVVDADLRSPTLGEPEGGGFAALLQDGRSAHGAQRRTALDSSLTILQTSRVTRSTHLLTGPRAAAAFASLRNEADIVLLSTPPAASGPDAAALADHSDGVILVAETSTSIDHLIEAGRSFQEGSIRGLLVIDRPKRSFRRQPVARDPMGSVMG